MKKFFSERDQIRNLLRIWSHLLKNSLMENFIFLLSNKNTLISSGDRRINPLMPGGKKRSHVFKKTCSFWL